MAVLLWKGQRTMKKSFTEKLASRKLWVTLIGFITALMVALGSAPDSITKVVGVVSAFGVIVAYLFAQGIADGNEVVIDEDDLREIIEDVVDEKMAVVPDETDTLGLGDIEYDDPRG